MEVAEDRDRADQQSQISLHFLQEERVLEGPWLQKGELKILTFLSGTKPWQLPADQVRFLHLVDIQEMSSNDMIGYGIHYPVRHGLVENWVRKSLLGGLSAETDRCRIIWSVFGQTQYSNICEWSPKTTIFFLQNLYASSGKRTVSLD